MNIITKFLLGITLIFSATITESIFAKNTLIKKMAKPELDEAFISAVKNYHVEEMQKLIELGADVNAPIPDMMSYSKCSPLVFAIRYGGTEMVEMVKILLKVKNKLSTTLNEALDEAIGGSLTEIPKILIKEGADVNHVNKHGETAFIIAVKNGASENIKILLKAGADINQVNERGETALIIAVESGASESIKTLLEAGSDINQVNERGETALMIAIKNGISWCIKTLLEAGADINRADLEKASISTDKAFISAVERHDTKTMQKLIELGANINAPISYTWSQGDWDVAMECSPIMFAIKDKNTEMVKILLKVKNKLSDTLNQALDQAIRCGCTEIAEILLKEGADVNYINNEDKNTPLISAANKGLIKFIPILLKAGADINHANIRGETALMIAIEHGFTKTMQILLKAGADINAGAGINNVDEFGKTALMRAVEKYDLDTVQELLKFPEITKGSFLGFGKKPINNADENGNTALIIAIKNIRSSYIVGHNYEYDICIKSQKIVETLLKTPGIDLYHVNKNGETAIALLDHGTYASKC